MRKILPVFWLLLITLVAMGVLAQDEPWEAWLYNSRDGMVLRLGSGGDLLGAYALPAPANLSTFGFGFGVSPDTAFVSVPLANGREAPDEVELVVYRLSDGAVTNRYRLPQGADIRSFNQASASLRPRLEGGAFATGYSFAVDGPPGWEVVSLPYEGAAMVLTQAEFASAGHAPGDPAAYPHVVAYSEGRVLFALVPAESTTREFPGYLWHVETDTVEAVGDMALPSDVTWTGRTVRVGQVDGSTAPLTGEAVLVSTIGPDGGQVVYEAEGLLAGRAFFVAGDAQIGVYAALPDGSYELRIVSADGTVVGRVPATSTPELYGTPDGYLYFRHEANQAPVLMAVGWNSEGEAIFNGEVAGQYTVVVTP